MDKPSNPPAFPHIYEPVHGQENVVRNITTGGMTLRDWFAGQAMANSAICTGVAAEYELRVWFGGAGGITRQQIVAKQATQYADAMLRERERNSKDG